MSIRSRSADHRLDDGFTAHSGVDVRQFRNWGADIELIQIETLGRGALSSSSCTTARNSSTNTFGSPGWLTCRLLLSLPVAECFIGQATHCCRATELYGFTGKFSRTFAAKQQCNRTGCQGTGAQTFHHGCAFITCRRDDGLVFCHLYTRLRGTLAGIKQAIQYCFGIHYVNPRL